MSKSRRAFQIPIIKSSSFEEFEKVCNRLNALGYKADDGTGNLGHDLNYLGSMQYDWERGVRYLVIHDGKLVKKAITGTGFTSNKFRIIDGVDFCQK